MDFHFDTRCQYNDVFMFGSKIFPEEPSVDAISSLPLDLSWTIFSYFDNTVLGIASRVCTKWLNIILSNNKLRVRLKKYDMAMILGSENLAKFHRRNKRKARKEFKMRGKRNNYFATCENKVECKKITISLKRGAPTTTVFSKRMKLF